jgi:hypothetical protein
MSWLVVFGEWMHRICHPAIEDGTAYAFSPPLVDKPSLDRLGEVPFAQGRAADAKRGFETALKTAPNRALARRGLKRAPALHGNREQRSRRCRRLRPFAD